MIAMATCAGNASSLILHSELQLSLVKRKGVQTIVFSRNWEVGAGVGIVK